MAATTFAPHWSKLIARAWVDPNFKESLQADPATVLGQYGIHQVGSRSVADLAGLIDVVDGPIEGHEKPWMEGDRLEIPLPPAPTDYDIVDTTGGDDVAAAGEKQKTIDIGGNVYTFTTGTSSSNQKKSSVPSVPSISPSLDVEDNDGDGAGDAAGDGADAGADAGAEAGAGAGEAAGETAAAAGGADASADAAAAAAALCA